MNLEELNALIVSIPEDEPEMIDYYKKMRIKLIKTIQEDISKILTDQNIQRMEGN